MFQQGKLGRASWPSPAPAWGGIADENASSDDLSAGTTPEQRLEMVAVLSKRMWELSERPVPSYPRSQMPGRVIRPGMTNDWVDFLHALLADGAWPQTDAATATARSSYCSNRGAMPAGVTDRISASARRRRRSSACRDSAVR